MSDEEGYLKWLAVSWWFGQSTNLCNKTSAEPVMRFQDQQVRRSCKRSNLFASEESVLAVIGDKFSKKKETPNSKRMSGGLVGDTNSGKDQHMDGRIGVKT